MRSRVLQSWRYGSITFRLVCIYTLSALAILFFTTLTLYWIFTSRLETENQRFLSNNILVLQKLLRNQSHFSKEFLQEEVFIEPEIYQYYVRILDEKGHVILETPGMSEYVPLKAFKEIPHPTSDYFSKSSWALERKNHKSKYYLLMSALVGGVKSTSRDKVIQIAKDISVEHNIVDDYRRGLIFVLILGVIASAGMGIIVTRKGLQPLRDIALSTKKITVESLKERLNPHSCPVELMTLAIAFNEMLDRIENGFNRLSQFTGDLAHELRTPVTILMGEAEIALSRERTVDEYKEVLGSSLEEFQRISYMIDNLLFLARVENPQKGMNFVEINMQAMLQDIYDFYEGLTEEKKIKLYFTGNITILADENMMRRAIHNLASNAIKHTKSGGLITMTAGWYDTTSKYIAVSDNGEGISIEHIPHLFDRFYRVDSARSPNPGGTGLGLSIVRFIMDAHKGRITVNSNLGKGTKVTLIFPANS